MNAPAPSLPQPPPRSSGAGCCGMGCLTLVVLLVLLAFAFIGGGILAFRHVRNSYTAAEPVAMPEVITPERSAPAATGGPGEPITSPPVREIESEWKAFEKAADRNEKARLGLTAGEINALLQNNKNTRGRVFVSIEGNVARVRLSIPIKDVPMLKGRYLNGEATVKASPDGDPHKAEISSIRLSDRSVPEGVLDQRILGLSSMRGAISDWLYEQNITTFRIEDNRVISETGGNQ